MSHATEMTGHPSNVIETFLFGLACMMAIYCLMMLALARLNPLPFLRKYAPVMAQVFSMASSNASIPVNMEACEKEAGHFEAGILAVDPAGRDP